jgi:type II secretory pathway pseudopilin PulG
MKQGVRRGSVLIESMIAIALLALAMTGVSQLIVLAGRQQRIVESRRLAHREASNVMERVMARRDSQLSPDNLAAISVSPETRAQLPSAAVKIHVTPTDDGRTNQLRVEVAWVDFVGQAELVEVSAWRPAGSSP